MNQETNVQEKEARVRQPWTAQRVGDILLNNALLIIMAIAVVYIAIKNPNFIKPASLINILSQTAAYLPAALGIGSCWINRAMETFELPEGKALLAEWGLGENWKGVGNCILGYTDQAVLGDKARKEDRVLYV